MSEWLLDSAIHQFLPARSQADVPLQAAIRQSECIISGLRPQLLCKAIATFPAKVLLKATTPDRRQNMFDDQSNAGGITSGGVILSVVVFDNSFTENQSAGLGLLLLLG